jgi:hypothetical protein
MDAAKSLSGSAPTSELGADAEMPQLPTPDFLPGAGKYIGSVKVAIVSSKLNVLYRYTLDGSQPTSASGILYQDPIKIEKETTIKAIAFAGGFRSSEVVTAVYSIVQQTPTPTFDPPPGKYGAPLTLTISNADKTATIRFTTDGTIPTDKSRLYTKPIPLLGTETIKAIAFSTGRAASEVASGTYETPK